MGPLIDLLSRRDGADASGCRGTRRLALIVGLGTVLTLSAPPSAAEEIAVRLDRAVTQLKNDAGKLAVYGLKDAEPQLRRPHGAVSGFGPDTAEAVLDRMMKPFTGNIYQDTFIRWHLMWIVKEAPQDVKRRSGTRIVKLINDMPPPTSLEARPEYIHSDPALWSKYRQLYESACAIIGIPPYEKRYTPPDSYAYMTPERRAEAEAAYAEALRVRELFTTTYDKDAAAYNRRIRFVNWVVRQYRGELIYTLIWTGDPKMALKIVRAVDRHARAGTGVALDLVNFLYQASFEGALDLYDTKTRVEMSRILEKTARAADHWREYGGQERNFADAAFHLVYLLKDESMLEEIDAPGEGDQTEKSKSPPKTDDAEKKS